MTVATIIVLKQIDLPWLLPLLIGAICTWPADAWTQRRRKEIERGGDEA
jgi:hypothetical protein